MLSAHADAGEILRWLHGFKQAPRMTFITHGEPAASDALRHRIEEELGWPARSPIMARNVTSNDCHVRKRNRVARAFENEQHSRPSLGLDTQYEASFSCTKSATFVGRKVFLLTPVCCCATANDR